MLILKHVQPYNNFVLKKWFKLETFIIWVWLDTQYHISVGTKNVLRFNAKQMSKVLIKAAGKLRKLHHPDIINLLSILFWGLHKLNNSVRTF